MRGRLISLEGLDRCGKTTQCRLLGDWLRSRGIEPILTREPGGTALGAKLRSLVLDPTLDVDARTALFLFASDRADHVTRVIMPALAAGRWVLCDRFTDSTIAYQAYGEGLPIADVAAVAAIASWGLAPDLTLWIDTDLDVLAARRSRDRLECRDRAFHCRVRDGFADICQFSGDRVVRLDGDRSVAAVHASARMAIAFKLFTKNK